MRVAKVLLGGVVAWALASCNSPDSAVESASADGADSPPDPRSGTRLVPRPRWSAWGAMPWPDGDDALAAGLREAELHRDPKAEAIDQAWHRDDPAWRARSMWTLARIGGPIAREHMIERLADGRIELDAAALAAIGFLQAPAADEPRAQEWDDLEDRLWTRYAVTEELDEADALLLAIARVGGPRSSHRLAADLAVLPSDADSSRHVHGIEALAISCVRGHALPSHALSVVAAGLSAKSAEIRAAAAYALVRCASVSAEQLAGELRGTLVERLVALTVGDDVSSARGAWRALEGLGEVPGVVPATILGSESGDWMTEVAALRALVVHADGRKVLARRLATVDPSQFVGPRLHVLRELLERLRPFFAHEDEFVEPLRGLLEALELARGDALADAARTKALTLLACEIRLLLATRDAEFSPLQHCAEGAAGVPEVHGELLVIEALVHMGSVLPREGRGAALLERAVDPRPAVASNALGAVAGLDAPGVGEALREALSHADMGVVAAAAGAIATRASDSKRRDSGAVPMLLDVVRRLDNDHAVEARIAAITALGRLARSEPGANNEAAERPPWFETDIAPLARDPSIAVRAAARRALQGHPERLEAFDAAVPESFPEGFASAVHQANDRFGQGVPGLRLVTDAGVITIDFSGAPAPIAQANFAALAEGGFFDGLTFHRVVPGFVIQGGDPRGDGYGGPGHVMPCEWSNLRYERGTVGIALAGKDTGGSQLFIAHDAARHLDARYTVIGKVVEGMEVVDTIWPYDRIERVEILGP